MAHRRYHDELSVGGDLVLLPLIIPGSGEIYFRCHFSHSKKRKSGLVFVAGIHPASSTFSTVNRIR